MGRGVLLVGAEDHRLQRRVAGLDQVAGRRRDVSRQPVGQRGDQGVAARAEVPGEGADREQHPVTDD